MAENLNKRPRKGILKNSSSFESHDSHHSNAKKNKETKWDEMNIIATLHPADKDYGHMKIDEPKTPFNYVDPDTADVMDATELAERIRLGADQIPKALQESDETDDEEDDLTPEEKAKVKDFESKRKKHYNEFYAVKLARKLLEEDEESDEEKDSSSDQNCNPPECSKYTPP